MNYVGVDLHKEQSWFCVLDKSGKRLSSKSISNKPAILKKYFAVRIMGSIIEIALLFYQQGYFLI